MFLYPERVDMTLASGLASTLKGRVMVGASGQKPYYLVRPKPDRIPLPPLRKLWQPWNLPCRLRRLEIKRKFMLFYPLPVDFFHCGVVE